jgi:hypothetical protein
MNAHQQTDLLKDSSVPAPSEKQLVALLGAGGEDFDRVSNDQSSALAAEARVRSASAIEQDFDWSGDEVVLCEQRKTAVYWNKDGDLVIRQERTWDENDDPFMVIAASNVQEFLDAICDRLGIGGVGRRKSHE